MKKYLLTAFLFVFSLGLQAQEPYPELGAKLEEYFTALAGESQEAQSTECDFLIESCQDSLVRQYVALKIYDHYLRSHIMGDEAVAVHVAEKWFLSGAVPMATEEDLLNAQVFVTFTRGSLLGETAQPLELFAPDGSGEKVPASGNYSVLYFYDTDCSTCKLESTRLTAFVEAGNYPSVNVYAINTGTDRAAWDRYRESFQGVTHLWDPSMESSWQMKYGVLKTPAMFLVGPDGKILGRGLDTPALEILLNKAFSSGKYVYGEAGQMQRYAQLFSAYGDTLSVQHVMDVADYLAARSFGEGDIDSFKQLTGDLLYYLSSRREEVYHSATIPFVQKYITALPEIWSGADDKAKVVSLGSLMAELAARTPVGSEVPDLGAHATLRRKPCLFRRGSKEGVFSFRSLKGQPGYLVFYGGSCSLCQETLDAVERLVSENRRAKVLLIDMDGLLTDYPDQAKVLLDSFDLVTMPFVVELDKEGTVLHKYVILK